MWQRIFTIGLAVATLFLGPGASAQTPRNAPTATSRPPSGPATGNSAAPLVTLDLASRVMFRGTSGRESVDSPGIDRWPSPPSGRRDGYELVLQPYSMASEGGPTYLTVPAPYQGWRFEWAVLTLRVALPRRGQISEFHFQRSQTPSSRSRTYEPIEKSAILPGDRSRLLFILVAFYDAEEARYQRDVSRFALTWTGSPSRQLNQQLVTIRAPEWRDTSVLDRPEDLGVPLIATCSLRELVVCDEQRNDLVRRLRRNFYEQQLAIVEAAQLAAPTSANAAATVSTQPPSPPANEREAPFASNYGATPSQPGGPAVAPSPPPSITVPSQSMAQDSIRPPLGGVLLLRERRVAEEFLARWESSCDTRTPLAAQDTAAARITETLLRPLNRANLAPDAWACLVVSEAPPRGAAAYDRWCVPDLRLGLGLVARLDMLDRFPCRAQTMTVDVDVSIMPVTEMAPSAAVWASRAVRATSQEMAELRGQIDIQGQTVDEQGRLRLAMQDWEQLRTPGQNRQALASRPGTGIRNGLYRIEAIDAFGSNRLTLVLRPQFVTLNTLRFHAMTASGRQASTCEPVLEIDPSARLTRVGSAAPFDPPADDRRLAYVPAQRFEYRRASPVIRLAWANLAPDEPHPHVRLRLPAPCNAAGDNHPLAPAAFTSEGWRLTVTPRQPSMLVLATSSPGADQADASGLGVSPSEVEPLWTGLIELTQAIDQLRPGGQDWGRVMFTLQGANRAFGGAELKVREAPGQIIPNPATRRELFSQVTDRLGREPLASTPHFRIGAESARNELLVQLTGRASGGITEDDTRGSLIILAGPLLGSSPTRPICRDLRGGADELNRWLQRFGLRLLLIDLARPGDDFRTPVRQQPWLSRCDLPESPNIMAFSINPEGGLTPRNVQSAFHHITEEARRFAVPR